MSRGHIGHPKPDIVEASICTKTMTDILESIGLAPSDGSTAIRNGFVWQTVQWSGYPTAKVVIGGHRANHLQAQSQEPHNCWLDFDHASVHRECCECVENTLWATRGGNKEMLPSTLVIIII